jgi:hypothetical protein
MIPGLSAIAALTLLGIGAFFGKVSPVRLAIATTVFAVVAAFNLPKWWAFVIMVLTLVIFISLGLGGR